ncbi:ubiquitin carboxyl-terminal hydrolase 8 [Geosmithia morbida]|uniref:Ubiquitin carboxyl-terminal hydrolase 8 n=1 Tax=Geosmithia morbida TaxID=1094350 RepID=A0A9P5D6E7_9HYPO|nr:ubiquitin carboxyl-terminal hydrolase 8 [Geosmithia morbida]KAF4125536.1 ubiquitin carboxyl-terminal hydrolase 8 [Geosmithia morbida]
MAGPTSNGGAPRAGAAPLPHIDDITAAPKDIDPNQSLKRLLELSETSLRSAEMSRELGRPANALKDYIRASIIAVRVIQHHKDYPTMQSNRGNELYKKHNALLKQIHSLYDAYDKVKADIRQDNKRTGVMPLLTSSRPSSSHGSASEPHAVSLPSIQSNGTTSPPPPTNGASTNGAPAKAKPTPRPKPPSLHGNTLKAAHGRSQSTTSVANDLLAARFASLRGPQAYPGQDPRIKTHPFGAPGKPAGPRAMPTSNPKPKVEIDTATPSLPKLPEAIYSPARGNMSEESVRLPTSTPRGPFTRTGSSASIAGSPSASSQPSRKDYFTPIPTSSMSGGPSSLGGPSTDQSSIVSSPKVSMDLSSREVIEAEELYRTMKDNSAVLVIDIRPREEFDEGHIMSSSVICIEPSILAREDLSADSIAESLIISPDPESSLFEKRNDYDLVVMYDQDSEEIPRFPRSQDDLAISSLHRALLHLNYGRELKQPPRLLRGGIDAWVDLMGPGSLQATSAATSRTAQLRRSAAVGRRKSKYRVTPMKVDDIRAWQETVRNDMENAESPSLYRSTEDFVRRFPAVPVEPEIMTSSSPLIPTRPPPRPPKEPAEYRPPVPSPVPTLDRQQQHQHVVGDLPAPLERPAPAVSRPSHSGMTIGAGDQGGGGYGDANSALTSSQQNAGRGPKPADYQQPLASDVAIYYTGLNNPHQWCYANSILQSLLACEFGKELTDPAWKKRYTVPKRANETIEQPQLMMQILSNLFHWMSTGKFEVMKASTLMNYAYHISVQTKAVEKFGDNCQHDAQEFMTFLLTHLDDETNVQRNQPGYPSQPDTSSQSVLSASMEFWRNHSRHHQSMVDRYWRLIELGITECHHCGNESYNFRTVDMITPSIGDADASLERALADHVGGNILDDYFCDRCKGHKRATTRLAYPRMPSLLCVGFNRFGYDVGGSTKSTARITWDLNHLDMSRYFLRPDPCPSSSSTSTSPSPPNPPPSSSSSSSSHPQQQQQQQQPTDKAFSGRFAYECFAVVEHTGTTANSGHYTAYVRDPRTHDPSAWLYCDDSRVTKVRMDNHHDRQKLFKDRDRVPYLAFFRRKYGS